MSEVAQAFAWINTTLRADTVLMAAATGGVWQGLADIGITPPFVSYGLQSNSDVLTVNASRLWANLLVQIKMVGLTSNYAALVMGADRIDVLFGRLGPVGLPGGGGVLSCYRDGALSYSELINGAAWGHLGGLYRIDLQGS